MAFTWGEALMGGFFTGTATTAIWYLNSMVAGHANMFGHVVRADLGSKHLFARRFLFLLGLITAGFFMRYALPIRGLTPENVMGVPWWHYLLAGFFMGFGSQICGGAMLGGLPFGSTRSLISFFVFFVSAFCIANAIHGGWSYISGGGKTRVMSPVSMSGSSVGIAFAMYAGLLVLYAVGAALKKRVSSILGSLLIMLTGGMQVGIGFALGGLLQQNKVIGALDLSSRWDPTLWVFTGMSLLTAIVGVQLVRQTGFFSEDQPPESAALTDLWLVIAAIMVGAGSVALTGLTIGSALTLTTYIFTSKFALSRLGVYLLSLVGGVLTHFLVSRTLVRKADKGAYDSTIASDIDNRNPSVVPNRNVIGARA